MKSKTRNVIGWVLTGIVVLTMAASATDKIVGSDHSLGNTKEFGISPEIYQILGIIELVSVVLFAIPKTGVLGLLLLSCYLGGGIATHLQHQQSFLFAAAVMAFIWMTSLIRFPELEQRIKGNLK